ncbi:MAG: peptide deformylase [Omnitrophica bacterium GWA2_52_8]|nr:MAG: peptide deformylase [Omnitrophica bacterium GWA2_52_8]
MALLPIKIYPDPVLTVKAGPLSDFGPKSQTLFDDMIETMYVEDGVGLAAPQVGISKRILIASPSMKRGQEYVMINPEIHASSGQEIGPEGCLSFPGISAEVVRAKEIRLHYQDRQGKHHDVQLKDFFARVVQHEMDHLNGILLIDRVSFDKRQELIAQLQQNIQNR